MSRLVPISALIVLGFECLALAALAFRDGRRDPVWFQTQEENAHLARALLLTDLAIWTEARFTRHPSRADHFTPFQNGPGSPDQFPSAIWLAPKRPQPPGDAE